MLYRTGIAFALGLASGLVSWLAVALLTGGFYLEDFRDALLERIAWLFSAFSIPSASFVLSKIRNLLRFSEHVIPFIPTIIGVGVFLLVFSKWQRGGEKALKPSHPPAR